MFSVESEPERQSWIEAIEKVKEVSIFIIIIVIRIIFIKIFITKPGSRQLRK